MAFAPIDTKLLWGRAAGICSNPDCRQKLTATGAGGQTFLTGEMAHQIAQSPHGPRGKVGGGDDTYDNLVLLCPTCHRTVDKAPEGTYSVALLREWKEAHENWVDSWASEGNYASSVEVAQEIQRLLTENRTHFDEYGPGSRFAAQNPISTAQAIWVARKLDTLLPNNRRIVMLMERYANMMTGVAVSTFPIFKMHVQAFEGNQYERVENYPLFPREFSDAIEAILR